MTDMGRINWSDPQKSAAMLARIPLGKFAGQWCRSVPRLCSYVFSKPSFSLTAQPEVADFWAKWQFCWMPFGWIPAVFYHGRVRINPPLTFSTAPCWEKWNELTLLFINLTGWLLWPKHHLTTMTLWCPALSHTVPDTSSSTVWRQKHFLALITCRGQRLTFLGACFSGTIWGGHQMFSVFDCRGGWCGEQHSLPAEWQECYDNWQLIDDWWGLSCLLRW